MDGDLIHISRQMDLQTWQREYCGSLVQDAIILQLYHFTHKFIYTLVPIKDKQNTTISHEFELSGTFFMSHLVTKSFSATKSKECTLFETCCANLASPQPKSATIKLDDLIVVNITNFN